jgi:hypothetical protein
MMNKICELIFSYWYYLKYKDADHIKIYLNVIGQQMIDALEVMADRHTSTVLILK